MSTDLFELLRSSGRLPSAPAVAMRVLELAQAEEASPAEVAEAISSDPALAARVLRFVNSPVAGGPRQVSSLNRAVCLLGMHGVQAIALSFSLVSSNGSSGCSAFHYERFWSKSLARATASAAIAQSVQRSLAEEAFVAGLLARIGQLVLVGAIPERYERVLLKTSRDGLDLLVVEREALGVTHLELGAKLLEEWQLPASIWRSIDQQREIAAVHARIEGVTLAKILYVADVVASAMSESGPKRARRMAEILFAANRLIGLDPVRWASLFDEIAGRWVECGRLLEVKTSKLPPFKELLAAARELLTKQSLAAQLEQSHSRSGSPSHA